MVYKNFKLGFILRILILTLAIFALVYSALVLTNFIRSLFSFALCVFGIAELLQFINKTNKDFNSFLDALIYEDFTNLYSKSLSQNAEVYMRFNKLNEKYRKIAFEKEVQYAFLQTIIKQINIGILVLDKENKTVLVNPFLLKLLDLPAIKSADEIEKKSPKLKRELEDLKPGNSNLIELILKGELFRLTIQVSFFKLDGNAYKLFSLQDINLELDEQEINSWQKLIRVLTHEIMNSVTPISSLSSSLSHLLQKAIKQNNLDSKHLEYLSNGLNAVQNRSEGLMKFTEAYKKLTQINYPAFEQLNLEEIFEHILLLFKSDLQAYKIGVTSSVSSDVSLLADKSMLEQVLINLVKNAIQELKTIPEPSIGLKCFVENSRVHVQVIDNGKGIPEDKIDKIFIPFFTTKEKGSGIGLSFARQVMRIHKGSINVKSSTKKTIFTLKF